VRREIEINTQLVKAAGIKVKLIGSSDGLSARGELAK